MDCCTHDNRGRCSFVADTDPLKSRFNDEDTVMPSDSENGLVTPTNSASRYLRTEQVAAWISVSPRVVRYWMKQGVLPYHKVGRVVLFRRDAVETALDRFKVEAISEEPARVNRKRRMIRFSAAAQT